MGVGVFVDFFLCVEVLLVLKVIWNKNVLFLFDLTQNLNKSVFSEQLVVYNHVIRVPWFIKNGFFFPHEKENKWSRGEVLKQISVKCGKVS